MIPTLKSRKIFTQFLLAFVCVSVVATYPVNKTSNDDGLQVKGQNLSVRMKIVLASYDDPLYAAGVNVMLYCSPILTFIGIIGNIMSFIVVTREKNRSLPLSTYMAALAVSDSVSLVTLCYLWSTFLTMKTWTVPACVGWMYAVFLSTSGSGFLLIAIATLRFMSICWPLKRGFWSHPKRVPIIVGCIIGFVAIIYIPMAIMSNVLDGNLCVPFGYDSTLNKVLANINLIAFRILPAFLQLIMNIMIMWKMRRVHGIRDLWNYEVVTRGRGSVEKEEEEAEKQKAMQRCGECKINLVLAINSCAYMVLLLPVSVFVVAYSFVDQYVSPHDYAVFIFLYAVTHQMYFLNNAINFYLYTLSGRKFRKDLKHLMMQLILICYKPKEAKDLQMDDTYFNRLLNT